MAESGSRFRRRVDVSAAMEPGSRLALQNTLHEPASSPASFGGGPSTRSGQEPASRIIKVGETLSAAYDLSDVIKEDQSSVLATITCIVTLERRMPALDITVHRDAGYYAIVVRGLNEYVNLRNWHEQVRVRGGRTGMRLVRNWICNASKGTLVVRVGMHSMGGGSGLPSLAEAVTSRKRGRVEPVALDASTAVDLVLERSIIADLEQRCNLDAVAHGDRKRLLTILYHVTLLDRARPLLDIRPVQLDTEGYVLTCTGFPNLVDWDVWYDALLGAAAEADESLRTLVEVSYNVAEGVLQLIAEGQNKLPAIPKRRRTRRIDDDDEDDNE